MGVARWLSLASATLLAAMISNGQAAEKIPPELAAKRSGVVSQATPSPLGLVYVPVAPCRAFFTPTAISANTSRDLQITGSGDLSAQGGSKTGCGVPAYAKAVAISVTAAGPADTGTLRLYATGAPNPNINLVSYRAGANATASSIVALGAGGKITAFTTATTKALGHVTGYFEPQLWAYVNATGALVDSSGRVASTSKPSTGYYIVTFDRDISFCSTTVSADYTAKIVSAYTSGNNAYIYMYNTSGASIDYWFNLHVNC